MTEHTFLFELGTEELPPMSLSTLVGSLANNMQALLSDAHLRFSAVKPYGSPRRLALVIEGLPDKTPLKEAKVWGPPAKIAFDKDGKPTKAALAFAKKNNTDPESLQTASDGKAEKLFVMQSSGGESVDAVLAAATVEAVAKLPIAKRMRWGTSRDEFIRPVHWVVCLLDNKVLDIELFNCKAANSTRGHRFHADKTIVIEHASQYESTLNENANVIVDMQKRKDMIAEQVKGAAKKLNGRAVIDEDLLAEVTALVEWPVALSGKFDKEFLKIPAEALISSMKEHQKYFHMVDDSDNLLPHFITVSNIESTSPELVIQGNEKVIRPRLSDAAFFFETDKKTSLEKRRERLDRIVFQAKLGSVGDKTRRVEKLSVTIAGILKADKKQVARVAQLCKADLVSSMVYEFPEMQGIAGFHYAKHDGESEAVALAIKEHYLPKFQGDHLPTQDAAKIVGLADRIDTLTGIFSIGQIPKGSKDPFALRRAALAVLRIIIECELDIDLRTVVRESIDAYKIKDANEALENKVLAYIFDRLKSWYVDKGLPVEIFQAVEAKSLSNALDFDKRMRAVESFYALPAAKSLAAANKRVSNILKKQGEALGDSNTPVNEKLFEVDVEHALFTQLESLHAKVKPLLAERKYSEAMTAMAELKDNVDNLFDNVMIMAEDTSVRLNRLALLKRLRDLFLNIADISFLDLKSAS